MAGDTLRVILKNTNGDFLIPYVDGLLTVDDETIEKDSNDVISTVAVKNQNSNITNPIKFWRGTEAQYNAIQEKDANTLYITGDMNTTINGVTYVELV